jgi:hypothetical protein
MIDGIKLALLVMGSTFALIVVGFGKLFSCHLSQPAYVHPFLCSCSGIPHPWLGIFQTGPQSQG